MLDILLYFRRDRFEIKIHSSNTFKISIQICIENVRRNLRQVNTVIIEQWTCMTSHRSCHSPLPSLCNCASLYFRSIVTYLYCCQWTLCLWTGKNNDFIILKKSARKSFQLVINCLPLMPTQDTEPKLNDMLPFFLLFHAFCHIRWLCQSNIYIVVIITIFVYINSTEFTLTISIKHPKIQCTPILTMKKKIRKKEPKNKKYGKNIKGRICQSAYSRMKKKCVYSYTLHIYTYDMIDDQTTLSIIYDSSWFNFQLCDA